MKYLTVTEFSRLPQVRLTANAVRAACAAGKIPGAVRTYDGGPWRIPENAVPGQAQAAKRRTRKDVEKIVSEAVALCG